MGGVLLTLGMTYISLGQYAKAEPDLRAALQATLKTNGEADPTTASTMGWLALTLAYQNKSAEGEQIARRAIELQRKLHPGGHEDLGVALYSLGLDLITKNEPKAAIPPMEEASELIKKHLGAAHGYYLATLNGSGVAHQRAGDLARAEALFRRVIELGAGVEKRYRIFVAQAYAYLGNLLTERRSYREAETILGKAEMEYRQIFGDEDANVGFIHKSLGYLFQVKGDYSRAEAEYKKALPAITKAFSREHPQVTGTIGSLGVTLTLNGKATEGETYLRQALEIRKKTLPKNDIMIPFTESALGQCLTAQKRFADAEPLLKRGYTELKASLGDQNPRTINARQGLANLYENWHKPELAAQ